jgi:hypothetical protein
VTDPTTKAIARMNDDRDQLRAEVVRLERSLVAAYTDVEVLSAERDRLCAEVQRLSKIGDTMFVKGYDQAVGEIRDHFRKDKQMEVVSEIEKTWMKGKLS